MTLHVLWFRCVGCGYRVMVSGPPDRDLHKYKPCLCGKCGASAKGQFRTEEKAA